MRVHVDDVVIFCHGMPYQPGSVLEKGYDKLAAFFASKGKASVIFDFSGTGLSKGDFSIEAWVNDLLNVIDNFSGVELVGFSLGGIPAAYASSMKQVRSLVLVATPCCFDHIRILDKIYLNAKSRGFLRGIGTYESFLSKIKRDVDRFEPLRWIKNSKSTMIVHGTSDDVIPFESGQLIYSEAREPKYFLRVINGGHRLRQEKVVIDEILEWLTKKKKGKQIKEIMV